MSLHNYLYHSVKFRIKKLLLLLFLFLLLHLQALSQTKHPSFIGFKGGLNMSGFRSSNTPHGFNSPTNKKFGSDFEVFFETRVSEYLTFQSFGFELSSLRAGKSGFQAFVIPSQYQQFFPPTQQPRFLYADIESERKLNYLLIPTVLKVGLNDQRKSVIRPYFSFGLFYAFLLSAKEATNGYSIIYKDFEQLSPLTSAPENVDEVRDIKRELRKMNYGAIGNFGASFNFNKASILIEGGGNHGFKNINKIMAEGKNKTYTFNVRVGLVYNIGKVLPFVPD